MEEGMRHASITLKSVSEGRRQTLMKLFLCAYFVPGDSFHITVLKSEPLTEQGLFIRLTRL